MITETKAVQNCIHELEKEPITLGEFLKDVNSGGFRKWHIFKVELSKILSEEKEGRSVPIRKNRGGLFTESEKLGQAYDRENRGLKYTPQINLGKCKTVQQKINLITKSDIPLDIKADLIAALY